MKQLLLVTSAVVFLAPWAMAQGDADETRIEIANPRADDAEPGPDAADAARDAGDALSERDLQSRYTEDHPWVDAPVFADGERIGEIDRVHFLRDEIDTVVIGVGGEESAGGGAVEVTAEDVERVARPNGEPAFELKLAMADFKALPGYVGPAGAAQGENAAEADESAE